MDDEVGDFTYSLNEAILHLNLARKKNVVLKLKHWSMNDEYTPLPTSFTGHANGDADGNRSTHANGAASSET